MDHGEDAGHVVVLPDAEVFEAAELFLEGEGVADDGVVDAHRAFCFDGEEEGFAHEGVLEEGGACDESTSIWSRD